MQKFKVANDKSPLRRSLVPFLVLFALTGALIVQVSGATTVVDCQNTTSYKFKVPGTRDERVMSGPGNAIPSQRSYSLGATIKPGTYKIYATGSDDHYNHRSASPTDDIQVQPDERIYVQLDGVHTPNATSDFTDYYDWTTASGKYQDDDNNLNTIPDVVYNDGGEYLGEITVTHDTTDVTFLHYGVISQYDTAHISSVTPSLMTIKCSQVNSSSLTVEKVVDGNNDATYSKHETVRKGIPATWKVTGANNGTADENNAEIRDCLPNGIDYVADSTQYVSGASGSLRYDNNSRCVIWSGKLAKSQTTVFVYQTSVPEGN